MKYFLLSLFSVIILSTSKASAHDAPGSHDEFIFVNAGGFEAQHNEEANTTEESGYFNIGYQGEELGYNFAPIAGLKVNLNDSYYVFGGARWNYNFYDDFIFQPSFSAGYYEQGGGQDMGGPLEFRTSAEVAYELENQSRVGVGWEHLSNASIYDENPGYDAIFASYAFPIQAIGSLID